MVIVNQTPNKNLWLARILKSYAMTFKQELRFLQNNRHFLSCLPLRHHFEKIKQVSSTKLTNWYKKTLSRWFFFLINISVIDANLKVSKILLPKIWKHSEWNKSITSRLSQNSILQKKLRSSKEDFWNLDFSSKLQTKETLSIHKSISKWTSDFVWRIITMIRYWHHSYEHSCTSNQLLDYLRWSKLYDNFDNSTKKSVEFQPSQWNSSKNIKIRTYLFVSQSSREHISWKKREVPKFVSRLFHVLT